MDVIINNPAAPQVQYAPLTQSPYGFGPGAYGPGYGYPGHHGGPGLLLPALLLGGFLLWRGRRRRRWAGRRTQRLNMAGGPAAQAREDDWNLRDDPHEDVRDLFRRGRERLFNDGALSIARERYARGEIDADAYEAMRRTLSGEGYGERREPDPSRPDARPGSGSGAGSVAGGDELKL